MRNLGADKLDTILTANSVAGGAFECTIVTLLAMWYSLAANDLYTSARCSVFCVARVAADGAVITLLTVCNLSGARDFGTSAAFNEVAGVTGNLAVGACLTANDGATYNLQTGCV
jgi:hypothetical protein